MRFPYQGYQNSFITAGRKQLYFVITLILLIGLIYIVIRSQESVNPAETGQYTDEAAVRVAVLYAGTMTYPEIYQHFSQPLLMNLEVDSINIDQEQMELGQYDMVYPDISVINSSAGDECRRLIIDYVTNGGAVFLENDFYWWFPPEFIGAQGFQEIKQLPDALDLPVVDYDLQPIQKLVADFYQNYRQFRLYNQLKAESYGQGVVAGTAVPLVKIGNTALYTINTYQKGRVFFTSHLLPNIWYGGAFDMRLETDKQRYFNNTVAAANQMIRNEFPAYIAKQKYGYAVKKVFGPYGRPAMAWQNHFEVLSAIPQGAMQKWIALAKSYDQIPSFMLARGVYEWFERYETIGYHPGSGTGEMFCEAENEESFYAPGRHVQVADGWLTLAACPEKDSYFTEMDWPGRAFPCAGDFNNDGLIDILVGSSDGYFYYYEASSGGENWVLKQPVRIRLADGSDIRVKGFAAPVMADLNGDGYPDLISGSEDGGIIWFKNNGTFQFKPGSRLVDSNIPGGLSAPDIGDLNGDRIPDLVAGSGEGLLYCFMGENRDGLIEFGHRILVTDPAGKPIDVGGNAAPRIIDLDGDGDNDLVVGNNNGYLQKIINIGSQFADGGFIESSNPNYLGNNKLKHGNNSVPAFADINGDGIMDLIVGRLEYGPAVGIDSPQFPYKQELAEALAYARQNYVSISPHIYTHAHKDSLEEQKELEMHRQAFAEYGLKWEGEGTNQHTWQINNDDPGQTFLNEYQSGLRWNSGFAPAGNDVVPSAGSEYTWIIPFYLCNGLDKTGMIIYNTAPANREDLYNYIGDWDTPVSMYMHMEYDVLQDPGMLAKRIQQLNNIRDSYEYNFMTDPQMAKIFSAILNAGVQIQRKVFPENGNQSDNKNFEILISPRVNHENGELLDDGYSQAVGIKLEPSSLLGQMSLDTDADIYMRKGKDLYIGLNRPVKVYTTQQPVDRFHIVRVNLPVAIQNDRQKIRIDFGEGGLQQLKIYSPDCPISIDNKEWSCVQDGDMYLFTRFGGPTKLVIKYS